MLGGLVAALVVYCANPAWWADPVRGVRTFLRVEPDAGSALADPDPLLRPALYVLAPLVQHAGLDGDRGPPGDARSWRWWEWAGSSRAGSGSGGHVAAGVLGVLHGAPGAAERAGARRRAAVPGGVRLPGLPVGARAGVDRGVAGAGSPARGSRRSLAVAVLAVAVGAGAWSTWRYHPLQLSYYNALIGGLSGASGPGWSRPTTGRR